MAKKDSCYNRDFALTEKPLCCGYLLQCGRMVMERNLISENTSYSWKQAIRLFEMKRNNTYIENHVRTELGNSDD